MGEANENCLKTPGSSVSSRSLVLLFEENKPTRVRKWGEEEKGGGGSVTALPPLVLRFGTTHTVGLNRGRRGAERAIVRAAGREGGERGSCQAASVRSRAGGAVVRVRRREPGAAPSSCCLSAFRRRKKCEMDPHRWLPLEANPDVRDGGPWRGRGV